MNGVQCPAIFFGIPRMVAPVSSTPFWRTVLVLAVPVALQMLLQSLLGMADVVMVSGLGAEAIAAVGLAAKLQFLLLVSMSGLATGCSVLIAQHSGAGNFANCQRTLAISLLVGMVSITPFVLLFGVAPELWLRWLNPDPAVVELTAQYLQITAPALLFTQLIVIYEGSLRALGNTTTSLAAAAVSVALNVALNYVLIFGHLGFPALGIAGAAWGTLIARLLQLVIIAGWIYLRRHGLALTGAQFKMAIARRPLARFIAFSLPLVANYGIWALGNATYHILTGYAGTHALAVMGIIVPVELAFFSLFVGLANACAVLVGRALGADRSEEAWHLYKTFDRLTLALVVALAATLWLARPWVLGFFGEVDESTRALLSSTLTIFCVLVWLKVLNLMRIIGVLRAGGDNHYVLAVDATVMWAVGLPVFATAIFWWDWPFLTIYGLLFLEDALKLMPMRWRLSSRRWMRNLVHEH